MLALALASAWQSGRPVSLPEAKQERLPCVSYAPFRHAGETPFDPTLRISAAAIEDDLRRLATVTGCVRTYGVDHGLDAVPAVARKLGMKVLLGAWIGGDTVANARELERALALAREFRDTVQLLIVGNEVLLRQEMEAAALAGLLDEARRTSPVPVSYADVWAFWLRHREILLPHVDRVAVHILPYWEDEPVGSTAAVNYVLRKAEEMANAFAPLPVFVAETGWPAVGRQRGPAVPGRLEQAQLVRGLLAAEGFEFNLIEGFDHPWKRQLEGAMGGGWGLFDASGTQRVPLTGPILPSPRWYWAPLAGLCLALALMAIWRGSRRPASANAWLALALGGGLTGFFVMLHALGLPVWSRDTWEWLRDGGMLLLAGICAVMATWRLADRADGQETRVLRWRVILQSTLLAAMAVQAFWLAFDGRYRPLPEALVAGPALLLFALWWLGDRLPPHRARRLLAPVVVVLAGAVALLEGPENGAALRYAGLTFLLALASF